MRHNFLMSCLGIFMIGTMLSCLCSGRWLLNGEINIFNALASFNITEVAASGGLAVPKMTVDYWGAIYTAFTWDYPFLQNMWTFPVRMYLLICSMGTAWIFCEVAISIFQGIAGLIKNLIAP